MVSTWSSGPTDAPADVSAAAFAPATGRARSLMSVDLGRPLAQSQAAHTTLADMKVRCEIGRRVTYRAARAVDRGDADACRHAALAALHVAVGAPLAARDALSIHGAEGALADHPAARDHRDAAMIEVAWESVAHLKSIVGGALLGMG